MNGGKRTNDLDLNVYLDQLFGERVDLHETGVDGAVEAAEFGDESDVSLADWLVGIRAADATWNGS